MRVGGTETIHVDVRILAATNADLAGRVAAGTFRSDLYYRLKVVTIELPPLRDRPEDIPILAQRFFTLFKEENGRDDLSLDLEAIAALERGRWDGNVRELRNLMESVVVLTPAGTTRVRVEDLPDLYRPEGARPRPPQAPVPAPAGPSRTMEEIEREAILGALAETGGNRTRAAELLGIGLRTLQRKLKEYDQGKDEDRSEEGY
jgi:DNA-binding NtrC family response regulator